ncbi:LPS export ABC transporter periplasmic protein LptC [Mucilaginibacter galii]|uniref:LPS export ABC transporter periplasmic protein LptC n=1 Tax=Mucilaginibacter galii TaxID=2005073 RepID=UPI0039F08C1B
MIPGSKNISLIKPVFNALRIQWQLLVVLAGVAMLSACENDLKAIQKISSQEVSKPINRTTGLDVVMSEDALVKVHLTSPLMIEYLDKNFKEMPKGLKVVEYDSLMKESSVLTADYGIQRSNENIIELRKNVVAVNAKGETFKSDELIMDMVKKEYHSDKPVQVTFADGTFLSGTNFKSDQAMSHWTMGNTTGQIPVNQNLGQ